MISNQPSSDSLKDLQSFHLDPNLKHMLANLESRIHSWSDLRISGLIETIETTIRNNHIRLMGLDSMRSVQGIDLGHMKERIESENHYLARTILPRLFEHVSRKASFDT